MADTATSSSPFNTRTVAWLIVAGLTAFVGFLWLTAYAPQLRMRGNGGMHPLSKSAVGFYGLYRLAETTGRPVDLAESPDEWRYTGFMIVTIDANTDPAELRKLVAVRRQTEGTKTLYILPKWFTMPLATNRGWVQSFGSVEPEWSKAIIDIFGVIRFGQGKTVKGARVRGVADGEMAGIDAAEPASPHYIAQGMTPVLVDTQGRMVLGRTSLPSDSADYILADPDLLSNQGLKSPEGARAALAIVDALRADENDSIAFDMVLNGLSGSRNLLQLMFEPPFLAVTLAVLAAALLVVIHAFGRFGPAIAEPRAIPFGKRALADNAAALFARAGAEKRLGDRYVALVRDAVAQTLGAGAMPPEEVEPWLTRLKRDGADFATLAAALRGATDARSMTAAAKDLFDWKKDVMRDR